MLQLKLEHKFSQEEYNKIINNITIHKLTIRLSNIENNSFYHHIIEEYYKKVKP